ncbi:MAG: AmmeMemoRadiSam system protein B [Alphaproteobacteria bacterium]|nr:AmmeMemoRadiSam system protein B [Alphaproteobacteria bacterium]
MTIIRPAAVAGTFYPRDKAQLGAMIDALFKQASTDRLATGSAPPQALSTAPKAVIAPHAGYIYSGLAAAQAYLAWSPIRETIRRVVLLGPTHRVPIRGFGATGADQWVTPLGAIPIDRAGLEALQANPLVAIHDAAHAQEHALEVHLPFLQRLIPDFMVLPLAVGQASAAETAAVLDTVWGGDETVILISSDLSHYLPYQAARAIDNETAARIEALDGTALTPERACGRTPIAGLLDCAFRRGLTPQRLALLNSGDTAGDKDRVVGYGAWAFWPAGATDHPDMEDDPDRMILARHGETLQRLAAGAIRYGFQHDRPPPIDIDSLDKDLSLKRASFVTLTHQGRLRGCVGSVVASRPLAADIAENAFRAAFRDPRFPKLSEAEAAQGLEISLSLLSPMTPIPAASERAVLSALRPGVDGLMLSDGDRRAVFLPQVWKQMPDPATFLARLKRKAGLDATHWSDAMQAWRFTVAKTPAQGIQ